MHSTSNLLLKRYFTDTLQIVPFSADISSLIQEAQLLVNATPVGMWPHTETMIWPHAKDFHAGHIVYDMVYNPPITRWLQQAQQAGATIISGLDMFIGQAAASFHPEIEPENSPYGLHAST